MEQRQLGSSGIWVSALALGCMEHRNEHAFSQLDMAFEHGVNFFDTAEIYPAPSESVNYGVSEELLGRWLQRRKLRSQLVLASKVAGSGLEWLRRGQGYKKGCVSQALEGTLRRLGCDYIDLYQLHWPLRRVALHGVRNYQASWAKDETGIAELLVELDSLWQAGKVRAWGVANETAWGLMQYLWHGESYRWRLSSVQNCYNLLNRRDEYHLSEVVLREKIGYLAYSPLAAGFLTAKYLQNSDENARLKRWGKKLFRRYLNPRVAEAVTAYQQLAKENNCSLVQLIIGFVLQQKFITSTLIGASSLAQLKLILTAPLLPEQLIKKCESIYQKYPDPSC